MVHGAGSEGNGAGREDVRKREKSDEDEACQRSRVAKAIWSLALLPLPTRAALSPRLRGLYSSLLGLTLSCPAPVLLSCCSCPPLPIPSIVAQNLRILAIPWCPGS